MPGRFPWDGGWLQQASGKWMIQNRRFAGNDFSLELEKTPSGISLCAGSRSQPF
jgi:hypothetical protein